MREIIEQARTIASLPASEGASDDVPIPVIAGYEIERELGRGGMGIVYQALETKLGRRVALKMIIAGNAPGEEKARFAREAEAVARLEHPNIVHIYGVGETEGRPEFGLLLPRGAVTPQATFAVP